MADMSYLKDMPIAILGAGAVGKTMAADCALEGKEVRLWDQPRFAKINFTNIEKTGITLSGAQFSYFGYQRKGTVKIAPWPPTIWPRLSRAPASSSWPPSPSPMRTFSAS